MDASLRIPLFMALALAGCTGEGGGARSQVAAPATHPRVTGTVAGATPGTLVHLMGPVAGATTVPALAEAVLDSVEVAADGSFALEASRPGPHRVMVSGPGLATTAVEVATDRAPVTIAPGTEARLELHVIDPAGLPDALALALVLGPDGAPLPLDVEESVTRLDGRASIGRLPAGRHELLLLSCDLARAARADLELVAGETARIALRPVEDLPLQARALRLLGQDELGDLIDPQVTR